MSHCARCARTIVHVSTEFWRFGCLSSSTVHTSHVTRTPKIPTPMTTMMTTTVNENKKRKTKQLPYAPSKLSVSFETSWYTQSNDSELMLRASSLGRKQQRCSFEANGIYLLWTKSIARHGEEQFVCATEGTARHGLIVVGWRLMLICIHHYTMFKQVYVQFSLFGNGIQCGCGTWERQTDTERKSELQYPLPNNQHIGGSLEKTEIEFSQTNETLKSNWDWTVCSCAGWRTRNRQQWSSNVPTPLFFRAFFRRNYDSVVKWIRGDGDGGKNSLAYNSNKHISSSSFGKQRQWPTCQRCILTCEVAAGDDENGDRAAAHIEHRK